MKVFEKSFLQQEPLPAAAIHAVTEVMQSGRLHRYDTTPEHPGEVALLEQAFAAYQGSRYCLACASGGYALYIAMLAAGVKPGHRVLCNAFTLAPVPGAIHNCGAIPLLVDTCPDLTIDLDDLEQKASQAEFLMLSHMRGHIGDMDRITAICRQHKVILIEDCAHTLGARWDGRPSGSFGEVSCFSTQTYKHLNSGEGGLLVTDDPELIARAIVLSGSYMLFDRHLAAPDAADIAALAKTTPNYSGRMDNMRAASLLGQLPCLDENCQRWNERYGVLSEGLARIDGITQPVRDSREHFVGSSIQFFLPDFNQAEIIAFVDACADRGVQLKYFGRDEPQGYTSRYDSWEYLGQAEQLTQTNHLLEQLIDMRVPLTFGLDDCQLIVDIIAEVLGEYV